MPGTLNRLDVVLHIRGECRRSDSSDYNEGINMNRITVWAVLLGFSSLGFAQDLSKKITVEIPASRATSALAQLGNAAGLRMEPAGNLKDEVFVISAHDATVDEIMQRIAQAESGKWSLQSGTYILT